MDKLKQQASMTSLSSAANRSLRLALLSMLLLIIQGTTLSIALRFSRVKAGTPYLASVSVLITEVSKLVICLAVQLWNCRSAAADDHISVTKELKKQLQSIVKQSAPMGLPAAMFVMQQVLLIVAASHLDAVAFQIFSQSFKLVPTALFAHWLLGQHLDPIQWASIPVLSIGVILVTLNNSAPHQTAAAAAAVKHAGPISGQLGYVTGMVACSISGLSSAYAGVYFEKYVKGKDAASLWVRNIQLGIFGVPLSVVYMAVKDGGQISRSGLLQGFDASAWLVVALQVFGGLVTGMVVKYCDNILKNFALAISVILTVLVVIPLFGQWPSAFFLVGVGFVLLSVFMYGRVVSTDMLKAGRWGNKSWLPWVDDEGHVNRQLLYVFLASTLAVGTLVGMVGMQRFLVRGAPSHRLGWRAAVAGANRRGQESVARKLGLRTVGRKP